MVFPAATGGGGVTALEGINLQFEPEEFVVALGASGCGKTTLLNVMAGFLPPTSGAILLHDSPITGPGRDRGVVFQKHALFPWLNVLENTAFGLKIQGVGAKDRTAIAEENLNLVGLSEFGGHPIYQLSGGMQQRVGLARALTTNPEILLMDEPLGALDAFTRENMQELVLQVWRRTKKIVFFITHSVEEALFMATRLIVMSPRPGRITHEYKLDFCQRYFELGDARKIKSHADFIKIREEVLSIIYGEEIEE
ncbi:MAG: ATP-binding cassette domain-containing protein [Rhodospirillales bacterium]|nr:ATP-binding cassette domain-containing protein [Rhodospirillales bacterium]MDH3917252.1 ATP-binding cassette domain-containing protein [Rhodospirillales bacterium]MDH3967236.1 ATP-binding cassette domain-containing protein [Rhodospirillales bacterium]